MFQEGFILPAVLVVRAGGAGLGGAAVMEEARGVDSAPAGCLPPCRTGPCPTIRFQSERLLEGAEQCTPSPRDGDVQYQRPVS